MGVAGAGPELSAHHSPAPRQGGEGRARVCPQHEGGLPECRARRTSASWAVRGAGSLPFSFPEGFGFSRRPTLGLPSSLFRAPGAPARAPDARGSPAHRGGLWGAEVREPPPVAALASWRQPFVPSLLLYAEPRAARAAVRHPSQSGSPHIRRRSGQALPDGAVEPRSGPLRPQEGLSAPAAAGRRLARRKRPPERRPAVEGRRGGGVRLERLRPAASGEGEGREGAWRRLWPEEAAPRRCAGARARAQRRQQLPCRR